jgi:Photosynthetic reaction centre cytochrome C subunit
MLLAVLAAAQLSAQVPAEAPTARNHAAAEPLKAALGVGCDHCHTPDRWSDAGKPAFGVAANMFRMVDAINERLTGTGRVSCVTCHGGATRPARQPRPPLDEQLARWPAALAAAPESQRLGMAVYNVALGVGCDHCHSADWTARDKAPIRTVALMSSLFEIFPKYMPETARTQCYMCHKGSTRPVAR